MWFNFLLFLLTTASITYGLTRSKAFKPLREWITLKDKEKNFIVLDEKKVLNNPFYWFLNHFFSCWYCNGFYSSIVSYILLHYQMFFVLYLFTGALFTLITISVIKLLNS